MLDSFHVIKYTRLRFNHEEGNYVPTETKDLGILHVPHEWSKVALTHALIDIGVLSGANEPDNLEFLRIDANTLYIMQADKGAPLGVLFKCLKPQVSKL